MNCFITLLKRLDRLMEIFVATVCNHPNMLQLSNLPGKRLVDVRFNGRYPVEHL